MDKGKLIMKVEIFYHTVVISTGYKPKEEDVV